LAVGVDIFSALPKTGIFFKIACLQGIFAETGAISLRHSESRPKDRVGQVQGGSASTEANTHRGIVSTESHVSEVCETDSERLNATVMGLAVRLAFLGVILDLSLSIIHPLLETLVWSIVLAVTLYPAFGLVAKWFGGRRRLAGALVITLLLLIVFGPVTWIGLDLVDVLRMIYARLDSGQLFVPPPDEIVKNWPLIGKPIFQFWELASSNLSAALVKLAPHLKPIGGTLLGAAGSIGMATLQFFASAILAGFLLSPGPMLVETMVVFLQKRVSRRGDEFMQIIGATIRNVSQGIIGVSLLQSLLAGFGLMVAGVPGAGLIALGVLVLGIIQIGPSVILVPVIIWSWITMETWAASIFTAYILPVNFIDNVMRPIIFARGLKTPMFVIIVGVVGGIISNGIIGLFIGPIVLAVGWDLLMAFSRDSEAKPA
jgi:predicted PurR-regulated permease PerM